MNRRMQVEIAIWPALAAAGFGFIAIALEGPVRVTLLSIGSALVALPGVRLAFLLIAAEEADEAEAVAWSRERAFQGLLSCLQEAIDALNEIGREAGVPGALSERVRRDAMVWRGALCRLLDEAVLLTPGWEEIRTLEPPAAGNPNSHVITSWFRSYHKAALEARAAMLRDGKDVVRSDFRAMPWKDWVSLVNREGPERK